MQSQQSINCITPPATIGILGGGQLGQMFAIKAREMGYKIVIFEPDHNAPARYFANHHIIAPYDCRKSLDEFVQLSDVITTEFENVPAESLNYLAQLKPTYPNYKAIQICQNRLKEKEFFGKTKIPTVKYYPINNKDDIDKVPANIFPTILKTSTLGYDGKGQIKIKTKEQLYKSFDLLKNVSCILEQQINLSSEVSVLVCRNAYETIVYGITENIHKNGILDISIAPAKICNKLATTVQDYAIRIIENLNFIGVLAIEFFVSNTNEILANEMAPRPHNSYHHTIESCYTSQFEQHIRAICNLKLGDSTLHTKAIMINLLGDIYEDNKHPNWNKVLTKFNNIKLHLYGKNIAKIGRKMGHLTLTGNHIDDLIEEANQIKELLNIN